MSDWCENKLIISGPGGDVDAFKKQALGHSPWLKPEERRNESPAALNFHSLVPIPDDVLAVDYDVAGYDWERENWGCKGGAANPTLIDVGPDCVEYEFHTAWTAPIEFLKAVARKWPGLLFELEYREPDARVLKGIRVRGGEID